MQLLVLQQDQEQLQFRRWKREVWYSSQTKMPRYIYLPRFIKKLFNLKANHIKEMKISSSEENKEHFSIKNALAAIFVARDPLL